MQQSKKELKDEILDDMNAHSDEGIVARVEKLIHKMYFKICGKISWAPLRESITLDFSSAGENGLLLPSNLYGIDRVRDEVNGIDFIMRDPQEVSPDEAGYRAYRTFPSRDPWNRGDDIRIQKGATMFTSATVDAFVLAGNSIIGEYLKVASEPGYYKITSDTSPYSISETYYGPDNIQAEYMIRPSETTRLFLIDPSETILQDRSVVVYYWSAPRPLYNDNDPIIFPDATILKLMILRELPEAKKRRPVSKTEMDDAMSEAKRLNPQFPITSAPRDRNNNLFTFNKNLYQTRR